MPRKETNYKNIVIYKIQHIEKEDLLYVGSTTDFTKRKSQHKHASTTEKSDKLLFRIYKIIRENGGWDMFKMIEIKKYPCNDKREACAEEDKIMQEMKATMNSNSSIPGKTYKYAEYQAKYQATYQAIYKAKHKERKKEAQITLVQDEKEKKCISQNMRKSEVTRREIVQCECGQFMTRSRQRDVRHRQTPKHMTGLAICFSATSPGVESETQ